MACQKRHDLVIYRSRSRVGVVFAVVKLIGGVTRLFIRRGGVSASDNELPKKCLCCHPLFIVAAGEAVAVSLIAVQKCKPHGFLLTG